MNCAILKTSYNNRRADNLFSGYFLRKGQRLNYYFKCPMCAQNESFSPEKRERSGLVIFLLALVGIIPAIIYLAGSSGYIHCDRCGYIFRQPAPPRTTTYHLVSATFVIYTIMLFAFIYFMLQPAGFGVIPHYDQTVGKWLKEWNQTETLVVILAAGMILNFMASMIALACSMRGKRKEMAKIFKVNAQPKSNLSGTRVQFSENETISAHTTGHQ